MPDDTPNNTNHEDRVTKEQADSSRGDSGGGESALSPSTLRSDKAKSRTAETSPTRQPTDFSTVPSAAAVQRALAHRGQTASLDGVLEGTRDRASKSGPNSPSWPTSPRLKSPPPSMRNSMMKKADNEQTASNTAKRLTSVSAPDIATAISIPDVAKSNSRSSGRGVSAQNPALETVAEGSVSSTPALGPTPARNDGLAAENQGSESRPEVSNENPTESAAKAGPPKTENEQHSRASSISRPTTGLAKRSFTSLTGAKTKVEPMRTMTIETEPVTSMPQLLGDRNREGGSIRTKPSNETIRPRKEKKKTSRKPASLHAGTGTSKADIFEAKVANAVDEADTSDSDETFVYESNPPEPRSTRHHSRTPSATSQLSSADHFGGRHKHGIRGGANAAPGKKSMKFSNSGYRDVESDGQNGTRGSSRTGNSTPRPHHIGRHGRNGHASILDQDSPFTQASKSSSPRVSTGNLAKQASGSRSNSPNFANGKNSTSPRKYGGAAYDNFEDAADDERAPLMGSVRINRNRHSRRPNSRDFRSMEWTNERETTCWSRFGGCIILVLLITLICIGVATFIIALNRALMDVEIRRIQNVLASEQELMLDLDVRAVNPNLFAITVSDLDVNIFAESPYVGTAEEWNKQQHTTSRLSATERRQKAVGAKSWFPFPPFHSDDGIDEGTDPIDDEPKPGNQKMLLGRIFEFDSPLVFDAAPIRRIASSSVGEIRLQQPGNKTEIGGSARWERVLQHPFDLIVRGVIKYQLPLSSKTRSAKISGRKEVLPDTGGGGGDKNSTGLG